MKTKIEVESATRAPVEVVGAVPVVWRRKEKDGWWVYYETKAWDDLEPLYTAPPSTATASFSRHQEDDASQPKALAPVLVTGWTLTGTERPKPNTLIVKFWKSSRSVWAGVYSGADKDSSFDEWIELPLPAGAGCPVCGEVRFDTPSGLTCANNHGGAKPGSSHSRDTAWTMAMAEALGLSSGFDVPLVPDEKLFAELFRQVRERIVHLGGGASGNVQGLKAAFEEGYQFGHRDGMEDCRPMGGSGYGVESCWEDSETRAAALSSTVGRVE